MNREIRYYSNDQAILRNDNPESRTISGYALVFNKESRDLGGFTEVILPEAMDGLFPEQDIVALYNHDESRGVLARYTNGQGTLTLKIDDIGLRYEFEADKTSPLAEEVLSAIRRGDINASSFAFTLPEGGDEWEKRDDDSYLRTIKQFKNLYDVSPVVRAAYGTDTSVAARKLTELRDADSELLKKAKEDAERIALDAQQKADLEQYHKEWEDKIASYDKKGDD